jgi:hypothetical protein
MDIMDLFSRINNQDAVKKFSNQVGADKVQIGKVVGMAIPTIMKAMDRNAGSINGAELLLKAFQQHQDDDVEEMTRNFDAVDTNDGAKILRHIFEDKDKRVKINLAKQTDLGENQVSTILNQLAPMLMGVLGQQQKEQHVDASNLSDFLGGAIEKSNSGGMMGLVTQLLDRDNDGDVIDDISGMIGGFFKKK